MNDDQEGLNTSGTPSVFSVSAGASQGDDFSSTAPAFPTSGVPQSGIGYDGQHCDNWPSARSDTFNGLDYAPGTFDGLDNAPVALYQNHGPLNWSTSELSHVFNTKIELDQEQRSSHPAAPPFWLPPHASQSSVVYSTAQHSSDNPPSFFSDYSNTADPVKRQSTFDASCLHAQNESAYSLTGPLDQPQLNLNSVPPPAPYCLQHQHGLVPNAQQSNHGITIDHNYDNTGAPIAETHPSPAAVITTPAAHSTSLTRRQDFTLVVPPKRRRGRPPKHDVNFPPGQPLTLSSTSAPGSILSPATIPTTAGSPAFSSSYPAKQTPTGVSHPTETGDDGTKQQQEQQQPKKLPRGSVSGANDNNNSTAEWTNLRSRNRQAAIRYRVKTQAAASRLEAEEQEISSRRKSLLTSVGQLREEVYNLKNEVLKHADCDCPLIQAYLAHAARQVYSGLRGGPPPTTGRIMEVGMMGGGQGGVDYGGSSVGGESSGESISPGGSVSPGTIITTTTAMKTPTMTSPITGNSEDFKGGDYYGVVDTEEN
ncbi:hypothetical protein QC763_104790 [Podospora pseudopauciseta]|uniref:BZIP domain-containing protein n=1 Tax=Podospora pseudopauciseta TaxID=2093780 RepID=A0ABR0HXJ4_9PEZI|nr:hypothetical protein QC763_104790 [Podospora pseudopauciseta]